MRTVLKSIPFLAVVGLLVLIYLSTRDPAPQPASGPALGSNIPAPAMVATTNTPPTLGSNTPAPAAAGRTNLRRSPFEVTWADSPTEAAKPFVPRINQWVATVHPYGLERSLTPEDFRAVQTNYNGRIVTLWAAGHMFQFHGDRLRYYKNTEACLNQRDNPRSSDTWTPTPAPWSKDEAVAEVLAIMRRLGNNYTPLAVEHEDMSKPTVRGVPPAPFHKIKFLDSEGGPIFSAEFRMEAAGSGRLTYWFDSTH